MRAVYYGRTDNDFPFARRREIQFGKILSYGIKSRVLRVVYATRENLSVQRFKHVVCRKFRAVIRPVFFQKFPERTDHIHVFLPVPVRRQTKGGNRSSFPVFITGIGEVSVSGERLRTVVKTVRIGIRIRQSVLRYVLVRGTFPIKVSLHAVRRLHPLLYARADQIIVDMEARIRINGLHTGIKPLFSARRFRVLRIQCAFIFRIVILNGRAIRVNSIFKRIVIRRGYNLRNIAYAFAQRRAERRDLLFRVILFE